MDDYEFDTKPVVNSEAVVKGENFRFSILTDGLVRCEWAADGKFEDRASTFAINRNLPVPKFRETEIDGIIDIVTDRFHLTYDKKPFSPSGLTVNVLGKVTDWKSRWRYGEEYENFGGTARTLDGVDGRCDLDTGVLSQHGHSLIDDKGSMLFDGKNWVSGRQPGEREDLYVFAFGRDHKAAIKTFFTVSGSQPEIPRWSLGNWWSRYHAYTADEYLGLMDRFQSEGIPFSVAVLDMDWHLVHDEQVTHSGWTGYTWDKKLFPDPKAFLGELHKRQLRVCPNDHPAEGVHAFEDVYEEMAKEMGFDTSHKDPIQFDSTSPKFLRAYLNMFRSLGMDFPWIDWQQGTHSRVPGIDPLWMLNHFHFLDNARKSGKPLIFSRYAGPGSHRYPVGFSGDTQVTWASLEFQPEFTATASNIGFGWWSHDIGGHMFGTRDDEMATRWVQLGVYSPLMRLHSTLSQWMSKEPWLYSEESRTVMAEYLRWRHRMIPYLHSMNIRSARDDEPIVQPIYWHYPNDSDAYQFKNNYFFGSEMFVAPITKPRDAMTGLASAKAWLPLGARFVDLYTGLVYDSNRIISMYRPLKQFPVLAREGSIIPLDLANTPKNGGYNPGALEILVIVGRSARFELVEDLSDDPTTDSNSRATGERRTVVNWDQTAGVLTVESAKLSDSASSEVFHVKRAWTFRFISLSSVSLKDSVEVHVDNVDYSDAEFSYDAKHSPDEASALLINLPQGLPSSSSIQISFAKKFHPLILDRLTPERMEARLFHMLNKYQVEFALKQKIWKVVTDWQVPLGVRASRLLELETADELVGPVFELLLADSRE